MHKKFRSQAPLAARLLGAWPDLARAKIHDSGGKKYSEYDLMLRREYKRALDGNIKSIKFMLRILDANLKARDYHFPPVHHVVIWRGGCPPRPPAKNSRNADLALIILGIGAVSDRKLKELRSECERSYEEKLRDLQPDMLEPWVYCFARGESLPSNTDPTDSCDNSRLQEWGAAKEKLLADLMRLRGPGATRFKPGQSGNPKGRPRAKAIYPYEEFFMEPVTLKFGRQTIRTTRIDALLRHLVNKAAKGDDKLQDLLLPILAKLEEAKWEKANIIPRPRVIRGWTTKGKKA